VLLVLGAGGFVGRHVTALARSAGLRVLGAARAAAAPPRGWPGLDLAAGPAAALEGALRAVAPDVVVNCVGATGGDQRRLVAANVVAVSQLLRAMAQAVPKARLVHIGSAAEYGLVEAGARVQESAAPCPVGAYGVTKLAGTQLVLAARADGLDAVVLRVFNLIGPGTPASTLPGRLVRDLRQAQAAGGRVTTGPLTAFRDFVDVRDVAGAVLAAAAVGVGVPEVLNIGSGRATQLAELASSLAAISGAAGVVDAASQGNGSPRSAGVPWQQADISRAAAALGWSPATGLRESLRDMWDAAG
jgi:NDP-hexose 4-ketoreductase